MNPLRQILLKEISALPEVLHVATSGGFDSSALVATCVELKKKTTVVSFTFDDFASTDFKAAAKLADHFGLDFLPALISSDETILADAVAFFVKTFQCSKKTFVECLVPYIFMAQTLKSAGCTTLLVGYGADGHFGLSKKCMIHHKHSLKAFCEYRNETYSKYRKPNSHSDLMRQLLLRFGIKVAFPYLNTEMFRYMITKTWDELNKPRQKEALRIQFPELDDLKIKLHTNLQLGDSKIAERIGSAALKKFSPFSKSPISAYNAILNEA